MALFCKLTHARTHTTFAKEQEIDRQMDRQIERMIDRHKQGRKNKGRTQISEGKKEHCHTL